MICEKLWNTWLAKVNPHDFNVLIRDFLNQGLFSPEWCYEIRHSKILKYGQLYKTPSQICNKRRKFIPRINCWLWARHPIAYWDFMNLSPSQRKAKSNLIEFEKYCLILSPAKPTYLFVKKKQLNMWPVPRKIPLKYLFWIKFRINACNFFGN